MRKTAEYWKSSGLLEMYILGCLPEEERAAVEEVILQDTAIRNEVCSMSDALERQLFSGSVEPDVTVRPFLMATVDYIDRLEKGEEPESPPLVEKGSLAADFLRWTGRPDLQAPASFDAFHARIIGNTREALTAIAWLRYGAPSEVHHMQSERFLVLEGSCTILVGATPHHLRAGDVFTIPLHETHAVQVTSETPCKVILQRVNV